MTKYKTGPVRPTYRLPVADGPTIREPSEVGLGSTSRQAASAPSIPAPGVRVTMADVESVLQADDQMVTGPSWMTWEMTRLPKPGTRAADLTERDKVALAFAAGARVDVERSGTTLVARTQPVGFVDLPDGRIGVAVLRTTGVL